MAVSSPVELPPDVVTEPVAPPVCPEFLRAAELLEARGLLTGGYGDPGGTRCVAGYVAEAVGLPGSRPQMAQSHPAYARFSELYDLLRQATGERHVEEWSDRVLERDGHAERHVELLQRAAFGV